MCSARAADIENVRCELLCGGIYVEHGRVFLRSKIDTYNLLRFRIHVIVICEGYNFLSTCENYDRSCRVRDKRVYSVESCVMQKQTVLTVHHSVGELQHTAALEVTKKIPLHDL